ncbi:MAG: FG-GAP-like repeat-containing protein, partial [Saprospiraceae bacterium]
EACANSSCTDNIQNGDETGIDCGGANCPACPTTPTLLSLKTTEIKFAYPSAVYANSVNKDALIIIGEETGAKTGTYTVNANVITFTPSKSFKVGEQLYITSTSAIETTNRTAMPAFTWMEVMPVTNPTNAVFTPLNTGITLPSDALNHSYSFTTADFNQDGNMDIIINYYPARGSATKNLIYLQNANGTFNAPLTYSYNRSFSSLRGTPDLNGDGYPDLVVTHNVPSSVHVRLNNGDGTLGASSLYSVTNYSNGVEFADIDGDGDIDMIGRSGNSSLSSNRISIFRNKGDGTFDAQETFSTNNGYGHYLRLGDLDNDGDVDMIFTTSASFNAIPTFKVYENNGAGSFSLHKSEANPDVRGILPILDFNNDGQKDMISFNTDAIVHLGNTGLDFSLGGGTTLTSEHGRFHPGDINGDGFIDLLNSRTYNGTNWTSFPYKTYLNNGNGAFTKIDGTLNMKSFEATRLSDMDNDGDLDYLYVDTDRQIYIAENGNNTNFSEVPTQSRNAKNDIIFSEISGEVQLKVMPNPFQSQTTIKYYLPKQSNVTLKVLDFLGREISTLAQNKNQTAGWHEQQFQAANNAAGTYFLVLTNGEQQKTEKIILIK